MHLNVNNWLNVLLNQFFEMKRDGLGIFFRYVITFYHDIVVAIDEESEDFFFRDFLGRPIIGGRKFHRDGFFSL